MCSLLGKSHPHTTLLVLLHRAEGHKYHHHKDHDDEYLDVWEDVECLQRELVTIKDDVVVALCQPELHHNRDIVARHTVQSGVK